MKTNRTNQKILIGTGIVIIALTVIGVVLISGCIESGYNGRGDNNPEILNLVVCSKAASQYNDSRFLRPEEDSISSVFDKNSEIYVCGNITTSLNGDPINVIIYKIFNNQSVLLNVSVPEKYSDVRKSWDCTNISQLLPRLLLKGGEYNEYKIKYILGGGKNKKEKEISFKISGIQEQNQNQSQNSEKSCNFNSDCACGVHIKTKDCFYGNKNFVDESKQCPDFCTGIAANFEIRCVEGECRQINKFNLPKNESKAAAGTTESIKSVVEANNRFAFDIYSEFKDKNEESNIFFSPYSILTALAMTYEGARGKTAEEMQSVLHFPANNSTRRTGFSGIINQVNKKDKKYDLRTANALWAQKDYKFLEEYFKIVEQYYGGKVTNLDFVRDTENSRITINNWVENQTNNKIKDLISQGVLDDMTRLVITNAVYFKGTWFKQFDKKNTGESDFRVSPEKTVKVQMISLAGNEARFNYTETEELQILELPYEGNDLSMLVLLPKDNDIKLIEESISAKNLSEWKNNFTEERVDVYLPKFKFETKYFIKETLEEMGMQAAFSMDANFSGMGETKDLYISSVIHQVFVEVNEEGTEAAAATAVVVAKEAVNENKIFRADHPFIFIIQQRETGNILFIGRVANPKGG